MPLAATRAPYTLFIVDDEMPLNPREDYDCLGKMVCWHGRYSLGEKHDFEEPRDFFCLPLQGHKLSPSARERNYPLPHFFLLPYAGNGMISLSGGSSFGCFSSGCMALSNVPMSR